MSYTPQKITNAIAQAMDKFAQSKGRSDLQLLNAMNRSMEEVGNMCQDLLTTNMKQQNEIQQLRDAIAKIEKEHPEVFPKEKKAVGEKSEPPKK